MMADTATSKTMKIGSNTGGTDRSPMLNPGDSDI
jgi:hypothetical protein